MKDNSADIKLTFFNNTCDKYFEQIKCNNIYNVSGGQVKNAKRIYAECNNAFEILATDATFIAQNNDAINIAPIKKETIDDIQQLSNLDKSLIFNTNGTIKCALYKNSLYKACSLKNCNKKVEEDSCGTYRCVKCNKESSDFKWKILLQVLILNLKLYLIIIIY